MRIFRRFRENDDIDFVAANLTRKRSEIRQGRDHLKICLSGNDAHGEEHADAGNAFEVFHMDLMSEFVRTMRAENEFKLQENGIDIAPGQKIIRAEKIVVVLQADF